MAIFTDSSTSMKTNQRKLIMWLCNFFEISLEKKDTLFRNDRWFDVTSGRYPVALGTCNQKRKRGVPCIHVRNTVRTGGSLYEFRFSNSIQNSFLKI